MLTTLIIDPQFNLYEYDESAIDQNVSVNKYAANSNLINKFKDMYIGCGLVQVSHLDVVKTCLVIQKTGQNTNRLQTSVWQKNIKDLPIR